jgi:hypothetical protein
MNLKRSLIKFKRVAHLLVSDCTPNLFFEATKPPLSLKLLLSHKAMPPAGRDPCPLKSPTPKPWQGLLLCHFVTFHPLAQASACATIKLSSTTKHLIREIRVIRGEKKQGPQGLKELHH